MNKTTDISDTVLKIALAAVFAALVCIATIIFVIPIPATHGYFNLGETVIYAATLLFGPFVGGFAGGVGAGLADVINGYSQFAPANFIIKSLEGLIVGFLNRKMMRMSKNSSVAAVVAIVIGGLEMVAGYFIYEVGVLNYVSYDALGEVPFNIVQMVVGLVVAVPVVRIVLRVFPQLKN